MAFLARQAELSEIEALLCAAALGHGGAILVVGEKGIGKTSLMKKVATTGNDRHVLAAKSVPFERFHPYAVLHQLCAPIFEHRFELPSAQKLALETAFGLRTGADSDPFSVGMAVLGLLSQVARSQPLCCVIDDIHLADEQSLRAMAFVARRLTATRVAVLFTAQRIDSVSDLVDLPRLFLQRLGCDDALTLLRSASSIGMDDDVLERIEAEASGNPFSLLEFVREIGPLGLPVFGAGPTRDGAAQALIDSFSKRVERLPEAARLLVALAAAEPAGDSLLLRRAAELLGLKLGELTIAEDEGLLTLGPLLRFRHPFVRLAIHASVAPSVLRRVHVALADATDARRHPERRAWHRASSVIEFDENLAAELVRSAHKVESCTGLASAAEFLERAASLTRDPVRRIERLVSAAEAKFRSGALEDALALVKQAERSSPQVNAPAQLAAMRALSVRIGNSVTMDRKATDVLVDAAWQITADRVGETYLEVFASSIFGGDHGSLRELALTIQTRLAGRVAAQPVDLLLDAMLARTLLPIGEAVPVMRRAVDAARYSLAPKSTDLWWMDLVCQLAADLGDDESLMIISDRQVEFSRALGVGAVLPRALRCRAIIRTGFGRFDDAVEDLAEARIIGEAAGMITPNGAELVLAAWRGDAGRYHELASATHRSNPAETVAEQYAHAVLHSGLGNHEAVLEAAVRALSTSTSGAYVAGQVKYELVQAAARVKRTDVADDAMKWLEALASSSGTVWATAQLTHCKAALATGSEAEDLYKLAISQYARTGLSTMHARARLTYGEWLRRQRRRAEARIELRAALEVFSAIGARAFEERAAQELRVTGGRPEHDINGPLNKLTAQEVVIATKVASGATSKEVATTMCLSPRTIDAHLRNVYRKLGIGSRRQLRDLGVLNPSAVR